MSAGELATRFIEAVAGEQDDDEAPDWLLEAIAEPERIHAAVRLLNEAANVATEALLDAASQSRRGGS